MIRRPSKSIYPDMVSADLYSDEDHDFVVLSFKDGKTSYSVYLGVQDYLEIHKGLDRLRDRVHDIGYS